jgi:tetrahydromethanopterin S-methyltransferase subunit G
MSKSKSADDEDNNSAIGIALGTSIGIALGLTIGVALNSMSRE